MGPSTYWIWNQFSSWWNSFRWKNESQRFVWLLIRPIQYNFRLCHNAWSVSTAIWNSLGRRFIFSSFIGRDILVGRDIECSWGHFIRTESSLFITCSDYSLVLLKSSCRLMLLPTISWFAKVFTSYCFRSHLARKSSWFLKYFRCWMNSIKVVLGMDTMYSIILSAGIALFYTVIGGLYSVAYTGKC